MPVMRRGRSQVLFNYLPGKTFDFEGGRAICRVENFEVKEDTELNKEYVLRAVRKLLAGWRGQRRGYPEPVEGGNNDGFYLARPEEVIAEVFPLVFQCTNGACRRVATYSDPAAVRNHRAGGIRCSCGSPMLQIHHVLVCDCGEIGPLDVPSCTTHGKKDMMLDDQGSQVYANFRWVCRSCNDRVISSSLGRKCPECGKQMIPAVHRASSTYFPQYVSLVNLPGAGLNNLLQDPDVQALVAGQYLGLTKNVLDLVRSGQDQTTLDESIAMLRRQFEGMPEGPQRDMFRAHLEQMQAVLQQQSQSQRQQLIHRVKPLLPETEEEQRDLTDELLAHVRPGVSIKEYHLADLRQRAQVHFQERLVRYDQYPVEWGRLGLSEVKLIEDFPVTTCVVGYTRGLREARREATGQGQAQGQERKSILRAFPMDPVTTRVPIYVNTVHTEALLFQFDHIEVLLWLERNGVINREEMPNLTDPVAVKAWFLKHVKPRSPWGSGDGPDPVTEHVFSLLHSASHIFLRQAVLLSGLDRTSLAEYLFPRTLACAIYANIRVDFTLGGLHTLFEQSLHSYLRSVLDVGNMCVYDPVCREAEGHCQACLHISEVSCTHFNRYLSRHYLYGGNHFGQELVGFWDPVCRVSGA